MNRELRRLRTYLGRVVRDIEPKINDKSGIRFYFDDELSMAKRLLVQQKHSQNKFYSLHVPEVEYLNKGKAHKRYEFGVKASITVTNRSNFIVGGQSLPGNP